MDNHDRENIGDGFQLNKYDKVTAQKSTSGESQDETDSSDVEDSSRQDTTFRRASQLCEELLTTIASYKDKIAEIRQETCSSLSAGEISEAFSRLKSAYNPCLTTTSPHLPFSAPSTLSRQSHHARPSATDSTTTTSQLKDLYSRRVSDGDHWGNYNEWNNAHFAHTTMRNFTQERFGTIRPLSDYDDGSAFSLRRVPALVNLVHQSDSSTNHGVPTQGHREAYDLYYGRQRGEKDSTSSSNSFSDFILMPENPKTVVGEHSIDLSWRAQKLWQTNGVPGQKAQFNKKGNEEAESEHDEPVRYKNEKPIKQQISPETSRSQAIIVSRDSCTDDENEMDVLVDPESPTELRRKRSGLQVFCNRFSSLIKSCSVLKKSPSLQSQLQPPCQSQPPSDKDQSFGRQ